MPISMQNDPRYGHVSFVILSLPIFFGIFSVSFLKCFVLFFTTTWLIIAAILERLEYLSDTPRNTSTRSTASELLESIKGESNQLITELVKTISKAFPAILPKKLCKRKGIVQLSLHSFQ